MSLTMRGFLLKEELSADEEAAVALGHSCSLDDESYEEGLYEALYPVVVAQEESLDVDEEAARSLGHVLSLEPSDEANPLYEELLHLSSQQDFAQPLPSFETDEEAAVALGYGFGLDEAMEDYETFDECALTFAPAEAFKTEEDAARALGYGFSLEAPNQENVVFQTLFAKLDAEAEELLQVPPSFKDNTDGTLSPTPQATKPVSDITPQRPKRIPQSSFTPQSQRKKRTLDEDTADKSSKKLMVPERIGFDDMRIDVDFR